MDQKQERDQTNRNRVAIPRGRMDSVIAGWEEEARRGHIPQDAGTPAETPAAKPSDHGRGEAAQQVPQENTAAAAGLPGAPEPLSGRAPAPAAEKASAAARSEAAAGAAALREEPFLPDGEAFSRDAFFAAKYGTRPVQEKLQFQTQRRPAQVYAEPDYRNDENLQYQEKLLFSLRLRLLLSVFGTLLLAWLGGAAAYHLPLPPFLSVSASPSLFAAVNGAILLLLGLMCFSMMRTGLVSLFTLREDLDSLTALALLAAVGGAAYLFFNPAPLLKGQIMLYCSSAALCLTFNLLGKVYTVRRVLFNFRHAAAQREFNTVGVVEDYEMSVDLARELPLSDPYIGFTSKKHALRDFLDHSYGTSPADRVSRVLAPVALVLGLAAGAGAFVLQGEVSAAVAAFTAVCCIASPLMLGAGVSVPMFRASRRLAKRHAILVGYDDVLNFSCANALVATDRQIFPAGSVSVYGVKTFEGYKIEHAILCAASVAAAADSPLEDAFLSLIENGSADLLHRADNFEIVGEMGVSCWVDHQRVLMGNRDLMRHFEIFAPSRDYEAKYLGEGRDVLYLSVAGVLSAMFILEYGVTKGVAAAAKEMSHLGIDLMVKSCDPNINPSFLSEKLGISHTEIKVLDARESGELEKEERREAEEGSSGLAYLGGLHSYVDAVAAAIRIKGTVGVCTVLQVISAGLGMALIGYLTFVSANLQLGPIQLLLYQLLWALPAALIVALRRH